MTATDPLKSLEAVLNLAAAKQNRYLANRQVLLVAYIAVGVVACLGGPFSILLGIAILALSPRVEEGTRRCTPKFPELKEYFDYQAEDKRFEAYSEFKSACLKLSRTLTATSPTNLVEICSSTNLPVIGVISEVWNVNDSQITYYFFQDKLLIWDGRAYEIFSYHFIQVDCIVQPPKAKSVGGSFYPAMWTECGLVTVSANDEPKLRMYISNIETAENFCTALQKLAQIS